MLLTIHPAIFESFTGMQVIGLVAHGLDNQRERPAIAPLWRESWQEAPRHLVEHGSPQNHLRIKPWRECFRAMGVSPKEYPSAVEALLRRAVRGGEPFFINGLVNFYNAISLRHLVPLGGFDLEALQAPLEARLTQPGDTFVALDAHTPIELPVGEVAYTSGSQVLVRHLMWRQAKVGLITPATRSVVLVGEVMEELAPGLSRLVLDDLQEGLQAHFGIRATPFILDRTNPYIEW